MLQQVLLYTIAALVVYSTVKDGIVGGNLRKSLAIVKRIRLQMVVQNLVVQALVVFIAIKLNTVPILGWGWWQLLDSSTGAGGQNMIIAPTTIPYVGSLFLLILIFALPRFAEIEEEIFRRGTPNWKSGFIRSVVFGLIHCTAGVSIGIGLALSVAGLWFTYQYFKGGVKRSTAYHAAWNLSIITLFAVFLLTA